VSDENKGIEWQQLERQKLVVDIEKSELSGFGGRVETGAVQVNDDWPALFVRGDDSLDLAQAISCVLKNVIDPGVQQGPITTEEDTALFHLHYSIATLRSYEDLIMTNVILH